MEQNVNKKRKHAARLEKLKRREAAVEIVVKASLIKHLHGDGKKGLCGAIRARVTVFPWCYRLASVAQPAMLKECFDGAKDDATIVLPVLTCQSFYWQLMFSVDDAQKPNPHVKAYCRSPPLLAAKLLAQRHQGDRNTYSACAQEYMTNVRKHCIVGFKGGSGKFPRALQDVKGLIVRQHMLMLFKLEAEEDRRILGLAAGDDVS
eukprot:jgi/Pico_ML_1/53936/g444.t1